MTVPRLSCLRSRAGASLVGSIRLRDWFVVWTTIVVFAVLLMAWLLK